MTVGEAVSASDAVLSDVVDSGVAVDVEVAAPLVTGVASGLDAV